MVSWFGYIQIFLRIHSCQSKNQSENFERSPSVSARVQYSCEEVQDQQHKLSNSQNLQTKAVSSESSPFQQQHLNIQQSLTGKTTPTILLPTSSNRSPSPSVALIASSSSKNLNNLQHYHQLVHLQQNRPVPFEYCSKF